MGRDCTTPVPRALRVTLTIVPDALYKTIELPSLPPPLQNLRGRRRGVRALRSASQVLSIRLCCSLCASAAAPPIAVVNLITSMLRVAGGLSEKIGPRLQIATCDLLRLAI